jgi:hypothetical protein
MNEKVCTEVRARLPAYVARSLDPVRRRLIALHVRRCAACQVEFSIQREVHDGLASLTAGADTPPDGLLENASSPRGASPLRGAVSGARPVLSVALLVAGAAAGAGAGYASWLSAKNVRRRLRR